MFLEFYFFKLIHFFIFYSNIFSLFKKWKEKFFNFLKK